MKMKGTIVTTAILLTTVLAMAQTASAGYFSDRQQQQGRRIQQGVARGQITPREAEALYRDQREMRLGRFPISPERRSRRRCEPACR